MLQSHGGCERPGLDEAVSRNSFWVDLDAKGEAFLWHQLYVALRAMGVITHEQLADSYTRGA